MTYVITAGCIDILDKSCIEECPVDCIYEGDRMLYIQPEECVDCGACEPVCPQEAIYHEEEVPEELSAFVAGNRDFFAELGTPGRSVASGQDPARHSAGGGVSSLDRGLLTCGDRSPVSPCAGHPGDGRPTAASHIIADGLTGALGDR